VGILTLLHINSAEFSRPGSLGRGAESLRRTLGVRYSSQLISASVVGAPPLILSVIIGGFGFAALFT
jgi:hypothetical protein